jgi:hypothetical protein
MGQTRWPVPPATISVDLTPRNHGRQVVFNEEGMAYEATVEFLLIGRPQVGLDIALPEAGRLAVQLTSPQAQCEVRNVSVVQGKGHAEVVSLVPSMSRNQARELAGERVRAVIDELQRPFRSEASQMSNMQLAAYLREQGINPPKRKEPEQQRAALIDAYAQAKAAPAVIDELRKQCQAIADAHPQWVSMQARAAWKQAGQGELFNALRDLIQMQLVADYLTRHGIPYQDGENLVRETAPLVDAVAQITSGQIGSDAAAWRRIRNTLGQEGMHSVRQAVNVQLSVRLFPPVDPTDANAQWFLGQRVACQARDVSVIRVEGTLDPSRNDSVDWWILERYDPAGVIFEPARGKGFTIDPPWQTPQGTLLRVRATGAPAASYWFELRPANGKGRLKVTTHESTTDEQTEFPY